MGHLQTELRSGTPSGDVRVRLGSWKEIAAFFEKDVRTVRRWEAERSLPVHRIPGGQRGGVYAYVAELEDWLTRAEESPEPPTTQPTSPAPLAIASVAELGQQDLETESPNSPAKVPAELVSAPDPPYTPIPASSRPSLARHQTLGWIVAAVLLITSAILVGSKLQARYQPQLKPATASIDAVESGGKPSANSEAQELYLRGLYLWNQRTESSLRESVSLFKQAIAHDPRFAAAYAGLADSYILLRQYGHMTDGEAFPLALAANQQALALDDSSPEAHRTNAFLLNYWIWNFAEAEREFQRTLAMRPADAQAHHWYATSLYSVGRYREAMREIDIARRLQPDSISVLANRGLLLTPIDQNAAYAYLQHLARVNPTFASIHLYLSDIDEARGDVSNYLLEQRTARALRQDGAGVKLIDAAAKELKAHGEAAMYRVLAKGFGEAADAGHGDALLPATFYAHIKDDAQTLRYLKLSCDRHEASFVEVNQNPLFERLGATPEFQALMVRRATPMPLALALRQTDSSAGSQ